LGFVLGGIVGAAVGILIAPKSGAETRAELGERSEALRLRAEEMAATVRERTGPAVSRVRDRVAPTVEEVRERVAPAVAGVRERVAPAVEGVRERVGSRIGRGGQDGSTSEGADSDGSEASRT
jgi:gas vesicle protein